MLVTQLACQHRVPAVLLTDGIDFSVYPTNVPLPQETAHDSMHIRQGALHCSGANTVAAAALERCENSAQAWQVLMASRARRALGDALVSKISKKCLAVGRNYVEHAKEMGHEVPSVSQEPFFFMKPTTCYLREGRPILLPIGSEPEHEVELGLVIARRCKRVPRDAAFSFIAGYLVCIDVTARRWQREAKAKGLPWTLAKSADSFLPMSRFIRREEVHDPQRLWLWLKVNGQLRQRGCTVDMVHDIASLVHYASRWMTLEEGDIILTGTPAGVGPLLHGDIVEAGIEELVSMKFVCETDTGSPI
jgi:acylpyruvate hydrolase